MCTVLLSPGVNPTAVKYISYIITKYKIHIPLCCPLAVTLRSAHNFTVDCHNAHKGLGAGILVLVLTIISLVLFLVLHNEEEYVQLAVYELSLCEMGVFLLCVLVVLACMFKIRRLPAGRSLKYVNFYTSPV
jgi:hypothetical protein